jgi:uncharacterized membrane protein (DUF373 family)
MGQVIIPFLKAPFQLQAIHYIFPIVLHIQKALQLSFMTCQLFEELFSHLHSLTKFNLLHNFLVYSFLFYL